jgi:2TM domain
MEDLHEKASFERAKNKIERIKGLYTHLLIFITVNLLTLIAKLIGFGMHPSAWNNCLKGTLIIGSLSLLANAAYVYGPAILNKKGWEERKMQEFLRQEQHKNNTTNQK